MTTQQIDTSSDYFKWKLQNNKSSKKRHSRPNPKSHIERGSDNKEDTKKKRFDTNDKNNLEK